MINGDKNYFYHQGRYPEDDGLIFVGVDKKRKQCLYAKVGDDVNDYLSFEARMSVARFFTWGGAIGFLCALIFCLTLEPPLWIGALGFALGIFLCVFAYVRMKNLLTDLKKKCTGKMVKMNYEI